MLSITTLQNITNYAVNEAVVTDDARDVFPGLSLVETFSMVNEQVLAEAVLVEQYVTEAEAMQITCATTNPENLEALQEAVSKGILGTIRGLIDRAIKFIAGLWKKFTDYLTKLKDRFTKSANYKAVVADPKMKNKEFTWHDWNIEALTTKARKANSSVASRMKTYVQVMMKLIKIIGNVTQSAGESSYMAALSDQIVAATEGWISGLGKAYGVGEDVEDATDLRERVYKSCFNGDDTKDRQETLENILKVVPNPAKTIEDLKKMMGEASTNVGKLKNDFEDLKVALDKYAEEQSPEDQTAPAKNELMGKIARDISKMISVLTTGLNSSACVIISQAQLCTYDLGRVNDFCANVDIHAKESGKVIDVEDSELKPVQEAAEALDEGVIKNVIARIKANRAEKKEINESAKRIIEEYGHGRKLFDAYAKVYGHFADDLKVISTKEEMQQYVDDQTKALSGEKGIMQYFESYDMEVVKFGDGYAYLEVYVEKDNDFGEQCGIIYTGDKNGKPKEVFLAWDKMAKYLARVEADKAKAEDK